MTFGYLHHLRHHDLLNYRTDLFNKLMIPSRWQLSLLLLITSKK